MSRTGFCLKLAICLGLAAPLDAAEPAVGSSGIFAALGTVAEERLTPAEFTQRFPELWLVLPGDIVERSACSPYRRYVARVDTEGRIIGGLIE